MKPPTFQRGVDTTRLHQELMLTPVGGVVTYARLTDVVGKPVTGATGALTSARRIAQREDRAVFACVKGEGLKRLDDESIVSLAGVRTQGVRRQAGRVINVLRQATFAALREGSQRRVIALASVLTVVADLSREKSLLQVERAASGRAEQLPIKATLRALGLVGVRKEDAP